MNQKKQMTANEKIQIIEGQYNQLKAYQYKNNSQILYYLTLILGTDSRMINKAKIIF